MNEQIDESIPVLTEIISDSDGKPANLAPKVQESHFPVSAQTSTTAKETPIANTIKPVNAAIAADYVANAFGLNNVVPGQPGVRGDVYRAVRPAEFPSPYD